ncbi:MAG: alpha/beta hydrolase [Parvibaculum sp.]|uniref:alpha/beta hydrolase n=1 Tax=Parvibaculum sp. TaxID=2024848 RepID=UPI0025D30E6E|nr:alpha/beta hydrolase [Parvibaculum sp.]MCE9650131.1 alpha/beta hydrolase [Parvibaculum sp.]
MTDSEGSGKLARPDGESLAYKRDIPAAPAGPTGLVWLGGFKSDMTGTKATALAGWAAASERAFLRFDYFAHGASSGDFAQATVGRWLDDAETAFDRLTQGPQILIGSSMGGWIALLLALTRPERVKALVLIAPAPDFTEELMWKGFSDEVREVLMKEGVYRRPSEYDEEPYEITMKLIEEGRDHLLLGNDIALTMPVRILQGMADADVPWSHAMRLVEKLTSRDVEIHLSKAGDHRLSTPEDIARLTETVARLLARVENR